MSAPTGIAQYALLMVLVAEREKATHVKVTSAGTAAVIHLWRDERWVESDLTDRSYPFHVPLMRQLATLLSGTMPGQGQTLTGRFALERDGHEPVYVLGAIDYDFEVAATLELVDAATYESGRPPQAPGAA